MEEQFRVEKKKILRTIMYIIILFYCYHKLVSFSHLPVILLIIGESIFLVFLISLIVIYVKRFVLPFSNFSLDNNYLILMSTRRRKTVHYDSVSKIIEMADNTLQIITNTKIVILEKKTRPYLTTDMTRSSNIIQNKIKEATGKTVPITYC
jgi:hypothetical protein